MTVYSTSKYGDYYLEKGVVSNEIHYVQPFERPRSLYDSVRELFYYKSKSCIEDEYLFVMDTDPKEISSLIIYIDSILENVIFFGDLSVDDDDDE